MLYESAVEAPASNFRVYTDVANAPTFPKWSLLCGDDYSGAALGPAKIKLNSVHRYKLDVNSPIGQVHPAYGR
jgi:hypothetical protein